ncbi:hypothetical protein PUN28_018598 [Cardiocondyla obscurior]|uniref:Uncharacterized protein n=1 Tax=Cardiocondyla obscurior TaxID=286306 RepID=A0AAW2EEM6_9HYME
MKRFVLINLFNCGKKPAFLSRGSLYATFCARWEAHVSGAKRIDSRYCRRSFFPLRILIHVLAGRGRILCGKNRRLFSNLYFGLTRGEDAFE